MENGKPVQKKNAGTTPPAPHPSFSNPQSEASPPSALPPKLSGGKPQMLQRYVCKYFHSNLHAESSLKSLTIVPLSYLKN